MDTLNSNNYTPLRTVDTITTPQSEELHPDHEQKKRRKIFFTAGSFIAIVTAILLLLLIFKPRNTKNPQEGGNISTTITPYIPLSSLSATPTIGVIAQRDMTPEPTLTDDQRNSIVPETTSFPDNQLLESRTNYAKNDEPDALIFSYMPLDPKKYKFTITSDFAKQPSKYVRSFTVTSTGPTQEDGWMDFEAWLEEIGVTVEQRNALQITFK